MLVDGFNPLSPKLKTLILLTGSQYILFNVNSENLVFHQDSISQLMIFLILVTFLFDNL